MRNDTDYQDRCLVEKFFEINKNRFYVSIFDLILSTLNANKRVHRTPLSCVKNKKYRLLQLFTLWVSTDRQTYRINTTQFKHACKHQLRTIFHEHHWLIMKQTFIFHKVILSITVSLSIQARLISMLTSSSSPNIKTSPQDYNKTYVSHSYFIDHNRTRS